MSLSDSLTFRTAEWLLGASYNIDVSDAGNGRTRAQCRSIGVGIVSANAEHDICHLLAEAGYRDGAVQFWRGKTPSLRHPSLHGMGCYRVALGDQYPQRLRRKDLGAEISPEALEVSFQEPQAAARPYAASRNGQRAAL